MMDYERKDMGNSRDKHENLENLSMSTIVACHSLMQNKARNNFQVTI